PHLRRHARLRRQVPGRRAPALRARALLVPRDEPSRRAGGGPHGQGVRRGREGCERQEDGAQGRYGRGQEGQGRARRVRQDLLGGEGRGVMPSLKAIRTRIASVKNTQKITKALKLVAAAGLRRAQEAIWAARPYARSLEDVIAEVAARAGADAHPLLETRAMRRIEVIALTSDRGQAGAFNSNINRALEKFLVERQPQHEQILVSVLGRK